MLTMTTVHRRSSLLLCLAASGAAGMFLGPDGWFGIDIGPIGSAVLYSALWLLLIHLSKHSEEALPAEADQLSNSASRPFGVNLGMLIVGWIVVSGVLRSGNRDAVELDERDLRMQRAASRAGSGLMTLLIVANVLVGLLIANTLVENLYIVGRYRREHA
jgi:cytochrome b561